MRPLPHSVWAASEDWSLLPMEEGKSHSALVSLEQEGGVGQSRPKPWLFAVEATAGMGRGCGFLPTQGGKFTPSPANGYSSEHPSGAGQTLYRGRRVNSSSHAAPAGPPSKPVEPMGTSQTSATRGVTRVSPGASLPRSQAPAIARETPAGMNVWHSWQPRSRKPWHSAATENPPDEAPMASRRGTDLTQGRQGLIPSSHHKEMKYSTPSPPREQSTLQRRGNESQIPWPTRTCVSIALCFIYIYLYIYKNTN